MKMYIKHMVCNRCIMVIQNELESLGFPPTQVSLGEIEWAESLSEKARKEIALRLKTLGFEVITDKKDKLIEQIKILIIKWVHYETDTLKINLSDYLIEKLQYDYTYLSNLFSEQEGTTIEKYFIAQRIEKVKELLEYNDLSISEISFRLNYSSVAHLSNQFKKITGLTPTQFKNSVYIKKKLRKPLDEVK